MKRELKMVKRTLIVIAVVALMATSAQALGPEPHTGTWDKQSSIKVNIEEMDIGWPFEYKALDLCVIPVYMHVGYFVQVFECHKRKIKLVQVNCEDIGRKTSEWPCYSDCEDVKVRSNFEIKLGLKKEKVGSIIDQWKAYFKGDDVVAPSESWKTVTVCVDAWKARLLKATPDTEVEVGKVILTVKPNV
jgi:hypothetical protein